MTGHDVRRQIGHDAVMAANALAEFAARAEPVDRIVFDEAAEFDRGLTSPRPFSSE